ncbi:hypothetical protein [Phenylobacterium sp. SCN 70-31]|uniref:hypothetical protein n=1 Tax=Phenylobacterium sp. SCN 70-31 TaxID=1660129 RepID=UPI00086E1D8C|nr:hypothetical protein [Phenylobacterium sp. SCN 70-31]ODT87756.1 MAG: hypothetical protein ABS78_10335 [Phenylobacterium sp. SCN 70-31]
MTFVPHILAMALGAGGPAAQAPEPGTVKCRPAPYMVSDRAAERPAKLTLAYGPASGGTARSGQPCILMRHGVLARHGSEDAQAVGAGDRR